MGAFVVLKTQGRKTKNRAKLWRIITYRKTKRRANGASQKRGLKGPVILRILKERPKKSQKTWPQIQAAEK